MVTKTKAPQECGAYTKTQNIDMKTVITISDDQNQHFSIFYCGCKQSNLSTFCFRATKVAIIYIIAIVHLRNVINAIYQSVYLHKWMMKPCLDFINN